MSLGNHIAALRTRARLTPEQLAQRLGIPAEQLKAWEAGESEPDVKYLLPMAELLGVTTDELLNWSADGEDEDAPHTEEIQLKGLKKTGKSHSKQDEFMKRRFPEASMIQPLERQVSLKNDVLQNVFTVSGTVGLKEALTGEIHSYLVEQDGERLLVQIHRKQLTLRPLPIIFTGRPFVYRGYIYRQKNYRLWP